MNAERARRPGDRVVRAATTTARVCLFALAAVLVALSPSTASGDDAPTGREAIEQARALEASGHAEDAFAYLEDLVATGEGPLADEPDVLLEAARLAESVDRARMLAERAISATRNSRVLYAAHMLLGDSYFAQGLYLTASREYEAAARHESGHDAGGADIKRARSILASGDAEGAAVAYRETLDRLPSDSDLVSETRLGLARSLMNAGRTEEAVRRFESFAEEAPEDPLRPEALAGAAEGQLALGDVAAAVRTLDLLIEDYPGSYEAVLANEDLRELRAAMPDTTSAPAADSLAETPER